MEERIFKIYEDFLRKESGLVVTMEKVYLLESRLNPIAKKHNLADLTELANKIKTKTNKAIEKEVMEAMTTNETSFFRDMRPFDNLEKVILPYFIKNRASTKKLRIWSAACSSGQEVYSIAMILKEWEAKLPGWNIEIVASDISKDIIDKAEAGIYTQFEVQRGLPIQRLVKFFDQKDDKWVIKDELKAKIKFKEANLLQDMSAMGNFDIVFCRNVLIYFNRETKGQVLDNIRKRMPDDGVLLLGGAETVLGITETFTPMAGQSGMYIVKGGSFNNMDVV